VSPSFCQSVMKIAKEAVDEVRDLFWEGKVLGEEDKKQSNRFCEGDWTWILLCLVVICEMALLTVIH